MVKKMQNTFSRGYNLSALENDFKTELCNDYGYSLDYRKKSSLEEPNCHKTCCNHKKRVNKKVNNKK